MAATKQAKVLLEPEEYAVLEDLSKKRGTTLSELIREAVRDRYILLKAERTKALEEIFRLEIPVTDWATFEEEIEQAHVDGLP